MGEYSSTDTFQPTPAIRRTFSDADRDVDVISTPKDSVTHSRGWGDGGNRVQVVEHDCPECSFDRMIRLVNVTPVERDSVQYWCLHPNCLYFVRERLSYACRGNYPARDTDVPAVTGDADV